MDWDIKLAKELYKRNNSMNMGVIIGTIISPMPNLKISILDHKIILDEDNLYICDGLVEKEFKFEIQTGSNIGDIVLKNLSNVNYEIININIDNKDYCKIKLFVELKEKDQVLLIPTNNEQNFFVVDKIKKVGL